MNRVRAVIFAIAQINLAVMLMAFVIGIVFSTYYRLLNDVKSFLISIKYLISVLILLFLWSFVAYINRRYTLESTVELMITTCLTWLTVPLSSTIIYVMALGLDPLNAFFESTSGFTGTGLSILADLDSLPYVILTWRALTQWLGELGTVVIAGAILPFIHPSLIRMYTIERGHRLASTIRRTIQDLFAIYIVFTLLGFLLLFMSGMEPLDALIHSMTGIATGGMSSKAQNIGYWYFQGAQMILPASLVVMILGAQNFRDLYLLLKMRLKEFAKSLEVQGFFTILLLLLTLTIALTKLFRLDTVLAIYHLISGYTTTGFQVGNINTYPDALKTIIILAMIIGGATFSTAGGIKIRRIVIALKVIVWDIQRVVMPKNIIVVRRLGREVIDEASVDSTMSYIMLYAITLLLLSVGLHLMLITSNLTNYSFLDSVFEATSALSCVGLSVGITSASLPPTAKIILITAMYLGRLEFLPLYLSIGLYYMKKKLPG